MGGDTYQRDVYSGGSSNRFHTGGAASSYARDAFSRSDADPSTSPYGRKLRTQSRSPVILAFDVTGSNREFAKVVFDKSPMLYGQIEQQGYLPPGFEICFAAVGDANCDDAPLQVSDFNAGKPLDDELKKLWLESGGGGQIKETYELAAYFFTHRLEMPNAVSGFCFFIADEAPYAYVEPKHVQRLIGDGITGRIPTKDVFATLAEKFGGNVFVFLNPYTGKSNSSENARIRDEWREALGANSEHLIPITEEKSIVDLILGVIAMVSQTRDLSGYLNDMVGRGQTQLRAQNVADSLDELSRAIVPRVDGNNLPSIGSKQERKSGGKRV